MVDDLLEIMRSGLIGGGMDAVAALKTVNTAFDTDPAISFKVPCQALLSAFLYGPPDDAVGEPLPEGPTPAPETTESGVSAPITG